MARPRQFDPVDVDQALLEVFWSRGYASASLAELTGATGLLRGSLYAAYGSKEEMFRAAMRRYVAQLTAAMASACTGLAGAQHALDTVVRITVADPARRGCLILNTIPEARALSADTREELHAALRSMQALFRRYLRQAQAEAGTDLDLDPLVALLFGAAVAIRVLGRAGQDRRLLRNISTGAIEAVRRCFEREEE